MFKPLQFDLRPGYAILSEINIAANSSTLSLWFRTHKPGALLGCQNLDNLKEEPTSSHLLLSVDADGRLTAHSPAAVSKLPVTDGVWRHVALVRTDANQLLYLDGAQIASGPWRVDDPSMKYCEIGDAFPAGQPKGHASWMRFQGYIARVKLTARPLMSGEILREYRNGPL